MVEKNGKTIAKENRINYHGPYTISELSGVLESLDVVVMPSMQAEACPLVLFEALGAGRFVVASSIGSIPEFLGEKGILFPPGDADALYEVLDKVVREPETVEKALSLPWEPVTQETFVHQILELYKRQLSP